MRTFYEGANADFAQKGRTHYMQPDTGTEALTRSLCPWTFVLMGVD